MMAKVHIDLVLMVQHLLAYLEDVKIDQVSQGGMYVGATTLFTILISTWPASSLALKIWNYATKCIRTFYAWIMGACFKDLGTYDHDHVDQLDIFNKKN